MKKNLFVITLSLCLFPILVGLLLWGQLPEFLPTHWNWAGEVDGTMPRAAAIFGLPLFLAFIHFIAIFATTHDPNQKIENLAIISVLYWFVPVLCNVCMAATFSAALGHSFDVDGVIFAVVGGMFALLGFAMKRVKQNYTLGIRLPWTLHSEENWVRTHAFASPLWVFAGVAMAVLGFIGLGEYGIIFVLIATIAPMAYSYWLYHKGV